MSNETMQRAWEAAQRFVEDTKNLPDLIDAIKAHRTDELASQSGTPAADPTEPAEEETPS